MWGNIKERKDAGTDVVKNNLRWEGKGAGMIGWGGGFIECLSIGV